MADHSLAQSNVIRFPLSDEAIVAGIVNRLSALKPLSRYHEADETLETDSTPPVFASNVIPLRPRFRETALQKHAAVCAEIVSALGSLPPLSHERSRAE